MLSKNLMTDLQEYAAKHGTFTVTLGKTDVFPPSPSSGGAAVVVVRVDSPELRRIHDDLDATYFKPSNFPSYIPHITLGFIKPEVADKYKGLDTLKGQSFQVKSLIISAPDKTKTELPLGVEMYMLAAGIPPALKRWFGASKVVDAKGNPLVVYHGSKVAWISSFDLNMEGSGVVSGGSKKQGVIWFTSEEGNAHFYTDPPEEKKEASADSITVYGENPFYAAVSDIDGDDFLFTVGPYPTEEQAEKEALHQVGLYNKELDQNTNVQAVYLRILKPYVIDGIIPREKEFQAAKQQGCDGVIAHNVMDGAEYGTVYCVFSANQIKSATRNTGKYNPNDHSITAAVPTPIKNMTKSTEFKAWLGRSVVRKPVWHGTKKEFDTFQYQTGTRYILFSKFEVKTHGFFFAETKEEAGEYGHIVHPFFVKMEKPLISKDEGVLAYDRSLSPRKMKILAYILEPLLVEQQDYQGNPVKVLELGAFCHDVDDEGYWIYEAVSMNGLKWDALDNPEVVARMREKGFDGTFVDEDGKGSSIFVISPNQIKSADRNSGKFDPSNPSVTASTNKEAFASDYLPSNFQAWLQKEGGIQKLCRAYDWHIEEYFDDAVDEDITDAYSREIEMYRFATEQLEEAYDRFVWEHDRRGSEFDVFRCVTLQGIKTLKTKGIGECWAWDEKNAEAHWGNFGAGYEKFMLRARVKDTDVDWDMTIYLNLDPSTGENEAEIRLKEGVRVNLTGWKQTGRNTRDGEWKAPYKGWKNVTASTPARALTQDEFYASRLEAYKKSEAEDNGWRSSVLIYHGTDSITAEKIIQSGCFESGNDWPSFFTTRKTEATDYARIRAGQVKERGKDAKPFVFALKVAPYAVHLNKGSGEVETHTGVPLYLDGTTVGYVKDADLIKSFEKCNDPYWTYALYLKDYEQQGEASRELAGDAIDPELMVPVIVYGKVTGEKPIKDFSFYDLLSSYAWLQRKRDKKSKELFKQVEKWGIRLQNQKKQGSKLASAPVERSAENDAKWQAFIQSMEFPLTVYRAVDVPPEQVNMENLGSYWAVDEQNAWVYFGDHKTQDPTILRARVLEEDIDWEETYYQNIRYNWGETEVYLKRNAGIYLTGIKHGNDVWKVPPRDEQYVFASKK